MRAVLLRVLVLTFAVAITAQAQVPTQDVAAFMMSLKDEKAECRYLAQLFAANEAADRAYLTSLRACGDVHCGSVELEELTGPYQRQAERATDDIHRAVQTLLVKHDKLPHCIVDDLNSPQYPTAFDPLRPWHPERNEATKVWSLPKSLVK